MSRDIKVNICVTLKGDVLDPQGQAVHKTLLQMGFDDITSVRVGKYVQLVMKDPGAGTTVEAVHDRVNAMCERLLVNPVTEDFDVSITADEGE